MQVDTFGHLKMTPRKDASDFLLGLNNSQYGMRNEAFPKSGTPRSSMTTPVSHAGDEELDSIQVLSLQRGLRAKFRQVLSENRNLVATVNSYIRQAELVISRFDTRRVTTAESYEEVLDKLDVCHDSCVSLSRLAERLFERSFVEDASSSQVVQNFSFNKEAPTTSPRRRDPSPWPAQSPGLPEYESPLKAETSPGKPVRESSLKKEINHILKESPCRQKSGSRKKCTCIPSPHLSSSSDSTLSSKQTEVRLKALEKRFNSVIYSQFSDVTKEGVKPVLSDNSKFKESKNTSPGCGLCEMATSPNKYVEPSFPSTKESGVQVEDLVETAKGTHSKLSSFRSQTPPLGKSYHGDDSQNMPVSVKSEHHCSDDTLQKSFSSTQKHLDATVPIEVKSKTIDPMDLALMQELLQNFKELKSDKERTHRLNVQELVSDKDHSKTLVSNDAITQSQMKEVIGELRAALKEVGTPKVTINQPSTSGSSFKSLDQLKALCGIEHKCVDWMQLPDTVESDHKANSSVQNKTFPSVLSETNNDQQDLSKGDHPYERVTRSETFGNSYHEGERIHAVESSTDKDERPRYKEYEDTLEQSYLLNSSLVNNKHTPQTQMEFKKKECSRPIELVNRVISEKKSNKKSLQNHKRNERCALELRSPCVKDEDSSKNNTPTQLHNGAKSCTRQATKNLSTSSIKDGESPQNDRLPRRRGHTPNRKRTSSPCEVFYGGEQFFTAASASSIKPYSDPTLDDLPAKCLSSNSVSHEFLETNRKDTKLGARNRDHKYQPEYQLKRNSTGRSTESGSREKVGKYSGDFISHTQKNSFNNKSTDHSTLSSSCRGDGRDIHITQRNSGEQQDYFVEFLSEKSFKSGDIGEDVGELNTISDANRTCRNRAVRFHCLNVSGKSRRDKDPCGSKHRSQSKSNTQKNKNIHVLSVDKSCKDKGLLGTNHRTQSKNNKQMNNKSHLLSEAEDMTNTEPVIEMNSNHVNTKNTVARNSLTNNKIAYSQQKSHANCVAFETSPGISLLDSRTCNEESDGCRYYSDSSYDEGGSSPEHTYRCFNVEVPNKKGYGDTRVAQSRKLSSSIVLTRNMKRHKQRVQEPESREIYNHSFGDVDRFMNTSPSYLCETKDDQLSESVDGEDCMRNISYDNVTFGAKGRKKVGKNNDEKLFFKRYEQHEEEDPPFKVEELKCPESNQHTFKSSDDVNSKLKQFKTGVVSHSNNGSDTYVPNIDKSDKNSFENRVYSENRSDTLNNQSTKSRCLMKSSSESPNSVATASNAQLMHKKAQYSFLHPETSEAFKTLIHKRDDCLPRMKEGTRPKFYENMFKATCCEKSNKQQTQDEKLCSSIPHHMIDKRKSVSRKRLGTDLERKVRALDQIAINATQTANIENITLNSNFLSNGNDEIGNNDAPSSQSPFTLVSSKNNNKDISLPSVADITDNLIISPRRGRANNELLRQDQSYVNTETNNVGKFDECQFNFEKQQSCVSSFIKDIKEERRYHDSVDFVGNNCVLDLSKPYSMKNQKPTRDTTPTFSKTSSSEHTTKTPTPTDKNNMMVRITNLPLDVSELAMLQLARSRGHVVKIYFIKHKRTAEFQGVAYVRYESLASATSAALSLDGVTFHGAVLGAGLQEEAALPGTPMGRPGEGPDTPTPRIG